jgi:hypothetical protein
MLPYFDLHHARNYPLKKIKKPWIKFTKTTYYAAQELYQEEIIYST